MSGAIIYSRGPAHTVTRRHDMGIEIDRTDFSDRDFERFRERLDRSLEALRELLDRPGFGAGPTTIGAELELHLVDGDGLPAMANREVLEHADDSQLTVELARFNLEINSEPTELSGEPFATLGRRLDARFEDVRRAAATCGVSPVAIGILPTLRKSDLTPEALTDQNRYHALSDALREIRQGPFRLTIEGDDVLDTEVDEVTAEGANASFQLHLRTDPSEFADTYNAAQVAIGPCLAIAGNSPTFLGKRLWDETRIALFRQSVDGRPGVWEGDWRPARVSFGHGFLRRDAWELFAESATLHNPLIPIVDGVDPLDVVRGGGVPGLSELRLQQSTVWHWNRPVFDPADGGHLRMEMRALPSGPTVVDMLANAAFQIGLTLYLRTRIDALLSGMTFTQVRRNFYEAARAGLDAGLIWPSEIGRHAEPTRVPALIDRLLPLAEAGLRDAGADGGEISRLLGIIADRAESGATGARVQRYLRAELGGDGKLETDQAVVGQYLEYQRSGRPAHQWLG